MNETILLVTLILNFISLLFLVSATWTWFKIGRQQITKMANALGISTMLLAILVVSLIIQASHHYFFAAPLTHYIFELFISIVLLGVATVRFLLCRGYFNIPVED